jgi:mannose-6-phosphate isomerase-like protein (cupin superfamily)
MARLFRETEAKSMGLPGRKSLEIASGERGTQNVTLRLVEIPVPRAGDKPRGRHWHEGFEECIHVLSGVGLMDAESGELELKAGDTIVIPPGEMHVTRNTGEVPLKLLCFFPVGNVAARTREPAV